MWNRLPTPISPYQRFQRWLKVACAVILLGIGMIIFKACDDKKVLDIAKDMLGDKEKTAIVVNPNGSVRSIRRNKPGTPDTKKDYDGARGLRFGIDERGNVTATARYWGYVFEPGCGFYLAPEGPRVMVDAQVLFYKRHGLNVGLGLTIDGSKRILPSVAYSYTPGWKYANNTSLFVGIDTGRDIIIGARTKF